MKRMLILCLGLAMAAGCQTQAEMNAIFAKAKTLQTAPEYVIGEGDVVTIRVLGDEAYRVEDTVRPDGKISFPGHGDIMLRGKTVPQVKTDLTAEFQTTLGLKSPNIYVAVNSFASKSVTVLGEVEIPGTFPFTGQMRVADLLGRVRGIRITAGPNRSLLFREVEGNVKIYHVHLRDFLRKGDFSTNFYLQPGDILYIPKNSISVVAEKITLAVSPLTALLSFLNLGGSTVTYFAP